MSVVSSSAGLLSLLDEDEDSLKLYALQQLNCLVHEFWFQISSAISSVEQLYEDNHFSHRKLAALLASKVYYYLGEFPVALDYALGAEELFDINDSASEYIKTLLSCALDLYFERQAAAEESDSRLITVVERLLERCCLDREFEQAVGIALEARRLDLFRQICERSPDTGKLLTYAVRVSQRLIPAKEFRREVLEVLVELYERAEQPEWLNICHCLTLLKQPEKVGAVLAKLLKGSVEDILLAYQIGFDLVENEIQKFLTIVQETVNGALPEAKGEDANPDLKKKVENLENVISGKTTIKLHLNFLYSHNQADLQLLKNIRAVVDTRQSVCHSATVLANALMHCGTTVDTFLRENLDWLSRATNWAKFSATAGLGVIHKGHLENGQALMAPYLPQSGSPGSPYSEGGALFALGLIHANHGQEIKPFLLNALRDAQNEVIQHGACLGLGIAALGTESADVIELIKNTLYSDSAVAGEAAGIALGLINVGCNGSDLTTELLAYAHETQHEKIIRGIAIGLALVMYGQEEEAETLIEQMTMNQDPILRYSGMYVIGLAYAGTDNNAAIQKLLHFAVSDVSDDVRRAAVLCLGFVLLGLPARCPRMVSLLSESYNPHVRYGAAMAMGIACGGTGSKEAQNLLQPMLSDPVDFVRQGALISMAFILLQSPEAQVTSFRKTLERFIGDKTEETMCRMGAIFAAGILDAGGRNLTIGCRVPLGNLRRASVVGLALFTQYWYWYPLSYFLSLVFQPATLIGLNEQLALPKWEVNCMCKKSIFAYPAPLTEHVSDRTGKKVPTAVLSTTERAKQRARRKEQDKKSSKESSTSKHTHMDIDQPSSSTGLPTTPPIKKKVEPESYTINNQTRVVPQQESFIEFVSKSRWQPIKPEQNSGILILRDMNPGEAYECVGDDLKSKKSSGKGGEETATDGDRMDIDSPPQPPPFVYNSDDE